MRFEAARRVNNNGMREEIKSFFYEIINKAVQQQQSKQRQKQLHTLSVCASVRVRAHIIRSHLVACLPILGPVYILQIDRYLQHTMHIKSWQASERA